MKQHLPVLCAGLCLVLGLTVAGCSLQDRGPVYSVAAIQARLARHPDAWVGRTLLVRGVAVARRARSRPSPWCCAGPRISR